MRYCADTWFFVETSKGNPKVMNILRNVRKGKDFLVVPSVVLLEITRETIRSGKPEIAEDIIQIMKTVRNIKIVDADMEICSNAGKLSATHNIPAIDAIIATTAIKHKCRVVLTADEHFDILGRHRAVKKRTVK